ncbi:MAG TPA: ArdC-like ssDNA-binding domain-containing protein [Melioribacteraceae bacterium]|nr:ArdC-like ssDNA-binding domain-containing protein [Melioribacteraceae bacterium]
MTKEEKQIYKQEKSAKIKAIREKILSLSDQEREALSAISIPTIEGRFLSVHNVLMIVSQFPFMPTVVGGFKQWMKAGRSVKKGEHGAVILFPVGPKDDQGNLEDAEKFYSATVFDISQTESLSVEPEVSNYQFSSN